MAAGRRRYLKMLRQANAGGSDKWQTWEAPARAIVRTLRRIKAGVGLLAAIEALLPQP